MIISPVKKWIIQKLSSIALIPFIVWFLYNFASITNQNLDQFLFFLDNTKNKIILCQFLTMYHSSALPMYNLTQLKEDVAAVAPTKGRAGKV